MKFKDRFKKALFAFFKDEILAAVQVPKQDLGFSRDLPRVITTKVPLEELRYTLMLDEERTSHPYGVPADITLDRSVRKAKEKMFEKFCDFVTVDSKALLDPSLHGRSEIHLSIFVAKP